MTPRRDTGGTAGKQRIHARGLRRCRNHQFARCRGYIGIRLAMPQITSAWSADVVVYHGIATNAEACEQLVKANVQTQNSWIMCNWHAASGKANLLPLYRACHHRLLYYVHRRQ